MKFTIGIPTYNRAGFLPKALDCALAQDYSGPYEILVVNNASTDGTGELLQDYMERGANRMRVVTNPATIPMHANFNKMFAEARGEYVLILNDDDRIENTLLSRFDGVLGDAHNVGILCARFDTIDRDGTVVGNPSYLPGRSRLTPLEVVRELADHGHFIATVASACHRESFLAVGGFESGSVQFDLVLQMRLLLDSGRDLLTVPEVLAHVGSHDDSGGFNHFRTHKVVGDQMHAYRSIARSVREDAGDERLADQLLNRAMRRLFKYAPIIAVASGQDELRLFESAMQRECPSAFRSPLFRCVLAISRHTPTSLLRALLLMTGDPSIAKLITTDAKGAR